ncbi:unnamed protein product [Calypogeia fissa]
MENNRDMLTGSLRRSFSSHSKILPVGSPVHSDELQPPPHPSRIDEDSTELPELETLFPPNTEELEIPTGRPSFQSDTSRRPSFQLSRLGSLKLVAAAAEYVRQASKKQYGSAREFASPRSSSVRTVSFQELERGSSRYYKNNEQAFGQVVPLDDDDLVQEVLDRTASQDGLVGEDDHDLESGESTSQDPSTRIQREKSVKRDDDQTPTELQKQPSRKTTTKAKSRLQTIILKQSWFTVYKRLYLLAITLNAIGLTLAGANYFPYAKSNAVVFSLGNIMMCVLVRNEVFLRLIFWLAVHLLGYWWIPVKLKTMTTALLQSVGGIHSGCGLGAIMWLAYAIALTFRDWKTSSTAILGLACGILFLLVLSSMAAFPVFRHVHHNFFERVHRFAGWSSLAMVWGYVLLGTFWDPSKRKYRVSSRSGRELAEMQGLWLTVVTTLMVILPWLGVRRVAVETMVPYTKLNSLLHFDGGVEAGLLARISPSPFSEWHAFGIISDGQKRHTILAGAVGDFTKGLVERPPTHIWVRTFHFAGLPYLTNMYQKVLHVATGSGICVFLSFLLQQSKTDVHIIWIAKKIQDSYGDGIWEAIKDAPPEKITVIDTFVSGRPKTRELVVNKAKEWGAEVVIVTSNPIGTNEIVNGCKAVGIPAFGPIWDS